MMLLKAKLVKMAENRRTCVGGLFARAIFLTVQERFIHNSFAEKKLKYETLF